MAMDHIDRLQSESTQTKYFQKEIHTKFIAEKNGTLRTATLPICNELQLPTKDCCSNAHNEDSKSNQHNHFQLEQKICDQI